MRDFFTLGARLLEAYKLFKVREISRGKFHRLAERVGEVRREASISSKNHSRKRVGFEACAIAEFLQRNTAEFLRMSEPVFEEGTIVGVVMDPRSVRKHGS